LPKSVFSREAGNLNIDISGITVGLNGNTKIIPTSKYPQEYDGPIMGPVTLYVPLRFWFNKNPGLYLPLLAMQYHPIRINVTLAPLSEMFYTKKLYDSEINGTCTSECSNGLSIEKCSTQLGVEMWGDYVYLDVPERRRFVSSTLEYLIEQVQYTPPIAIPKGSKSISLPLQFNHPIKEFIWVLQRDVSQCRHEYFNWSSLGFYEIEKAAEQDLPEPPNRTDLMVLANIQLDGQDRFNARDPLYFRLVQPYQRHTSIPSDRYIYVYSIALRPEDQQPSGTLNASRIDNLVLKIDIAKPYGCDDNNKVTTYKFGNMSAFVYATNYNILRVINGYAGLLFSV
jgi:hypothetical protein